MSDNTRAIAEGLQKAIAANDAEAIGAGISALSLSLGGTELINAPWSANMQVLYVLCALILAPPIRTEARVVSLHGVPMSAGDGSDAT